MDAVTLIRVAKARGASDLHMAVGSPAMLRVHGSLVPAEDGTLLTPEDMQEAFNQITSEPEREEFHKNLELDFGEDRAADGARVESAAAEDTGEIRLLDDDESETPALRFPIAEISGPADAVAAVESERKKKLNSESGPPEARKEAV